MIRGRFTLRLYVVIFVIAFLAVCSYYFQPFSFYPIAPVTQPPTLVHSRGTRHLSKLITVVFRQFEDFDNDIADSVQSFVTAFPNMPVLVLCDNNPYPPFPFSASNETLRNVKVLSLELKLDASPRDLDPLAHILTEYVLFVPDSVRVSRRILQQALTATTTFPGTIIALGLVNSRLYCQKVKWNYADWTLQYDSEMSSNYCDAVHGQHSLLIKTSLLHSLPQPFALPFPEALYLQTSARKVKVNMLSTRNFSYSSILHLYYFVKHHFGLLQMDTNSN